MRQSVAASRISHGAFSNSQANIAAAAAKLLEKKKEFDAVWALERASTLYLERIEGLGEDCDIMADAGQAHGQVLEQWPKMFQILSLFREYFVADQLDPSKSVNAVASRQGQENIGSDNEESRPLSVDGQRLVRIPVEELQRTSSTQ